MSPSTQGDAGGTTHRAKDCPVLDQDRVPDPRPPETRSGQELGGEGFPPGGVQSEGLQTQVVVECTGLRRDCSLSVSPPYPPLDLRGPDLVWVRGVPEENRWGSDGDPKEGPREDGDPLRGKGMGLRRDWVFGSPAFGVSPYRSVWLGSEGLVLTGFGRVGASGGDRGTTVSQIDYSGSTGPEGGGGDGSRRLTEDPREDRWGGSPGPETSTRGGGEGREWGLTDLVSGPTPRSLHPSIMGVRQLSERNLSCDGRKLAEGRRRRRLLGTNSHRVRLIF